ncbi:periostin-related [Holotrichia oblita]|uniref:Periostin-related n=1 Tax=Holotrichia oblita TaxID=644536 RepID=A0ACB9TDM1_HOLOL|nr:periostin-related [Holotrichia oblita]
MQHGSSDRTLVQEMRVTPIKEIGCDDEPYTILAVQNAAGIKDECFLKQPEFVKKLLLDHMVIGKRIDLSNITTVTTFKTAGGRTVHITPSVEGKLQANNANIVEANVSIPNGYLIILDNYLFPDEQTAKKNCTLGKFDVGMLSVVTTKENSKTSGSNTSFIDNVMQVLTILKSGVRVFQHFLSRSNVSRLIDDENFMFAAMLSVNGAAVVKGDTPIAKGNIMFISEVLFVSEAVVSRLHQQHKDKETPPLLAFPWFGAQFLSHAFLALERDRRFSHITRFLNLADLAPRVSGTGYTFFVPTDTAFEELGLDKMPDNYLSTGTGLQILVNHFVKGRLYDRDLKNGSTLRSLGNKTIHISRNGDSVTVNNASIVESEVFVYNLGTMFYINKVLFADNETLPKASIPSLPTKTTILPFYTTTALFTTEEVERVPEEIVEDGGSMPDVLFADATTAEIEVTTQETDIAASVVNQNITIK